MVPYENPKGKNHGKPMTSGRPPKPVDADVSSDHAAGVPAAIPLDESRQPVAEAPPKKITGGAWDPDREEPKPEAPDAPGEPNSNATDHPSKVKPGPANEPVAS